MRTPIRWHPPESSCRPICLCALPNDLADVPIAVGFQSGSHYSTIQALEQYLPASKIKLTFENGMLFHRMLEVLIDGNSLGDRTLQRSVLFRRAARLSQGYRHQLHGRCHDQGNAAAGGCPALFPCAAQGPTRYRPAPGALHSLLQERISRALPSDDGYAALGPGRAHRIRTLHARGVRAIIRMDWKARYLSRRKRWDRGDYDRSTISYAQDAQLG